MSYSDHTLYLARKVPSMCVPLDNPLHKWSHEPVFQYLATSDAIYEDPPLFPVCEESVDVFVVDVDGTRVKDTFPQFDHVEIRPKSKYAVVCVVH